MLDRPVRKLIDPLLEFPAAFLAARKVPANAITVFGFLLGMISCVAISQRSFGIALFFILANRLADGLDGMVARRTKASDVGGFLDIVLDIIFYAGVPFAFGISDPTLLLPATFLIYSFIGTTGSFLAYAAISAKRGITTAQDGKKSFFYSVGLMEGTETIIFFVLFCLFPDNFATLAWTFGILCWLTTMIRILIGTIEFRRTP